MAETAARIGYGAKFELSTDGGTTFEELAEVYDITPPSDSVDVIDATHMQSPDATREFILGLRDPGECSMEMNFIPGNDADTTLQAVRSARERITCRITFPTQGTEVAVTWTFSAILTGYEPAMPNEDKMTATVTFKVTGSYVAGVAA